MDQTRKARLEAGGIMVDEALERFMGNEAMLERYLPVSYTHLTLPTNSLV